MVQRKHLDVRHWQPIYLIKGTAPRTMSHRQVQVYMFHHI